ncbi:helix-turn-helix domain-containing protein [Clostridioides difficile]|nr:helix-turn-helix domain-containing protein [Clostridioides difficile]MBT2158145.1 helix-turn-helix domain-containing protein [Clostridioides difficile]MBT2158843.1 helix-turn-helix domain-containing protein [Clostridioides difficile]MBT2159228.1 helix-turn-helix domain-containing protein [Clostridioides difficile]
MISYAPLWKLLIDRKIKKMEFVNISGISISVLGRLGNDKSVSMDTMEKICLALDCKIEDVVEIKRAFNNTRIFYNIPQNTKIID